jgi:xylulose-5-phosphate/fructose-6-phosphate phosphoketolase
MNRFHLAAEAIRRIPRLRDRAPTLRAECDARIAEATAYAREHLRGPTREP